MPTLSGFDAQDIAAAAAKAAEIKAAGYSVVGGYYFRSSGYKTLLTRPTAETLAAAGIQVFSIYENSFPTTPEYFTVATGNLDAHTAAVRALDAGQPDGTPVYFCVDYDCAPDDLPAITAYFTETRRVLESVSGYTCGVYGSGLACRHLSELGLVSHTFLSQSKRFANYSDWLPSADIVQGEEVTLFGSLDVDLDACEPDAGLWVPA